MKRKRQTSLGRYLYSLRIQRGFANISDYLRKYELPISDVYYRDLESGSKQISIEKAGHLCKSLKADLRVFYFHLLSDLLPSDVISILLRPIADQTFSSLEERQVLLERDKTIYKEALAKSLLAESHILSDEAVHTLVTKPKFMPVLHFLYATESATPKELATVLRKNHIQEPAAKVARMFEELGMALIDGDLSGHSWTIRRRTIISRTPSTEKGIKLKHDFSLREVEKTLRQPSLSKDWAASGSFRDASILELSPSAVESVRGRILDLIAEAHAAHEPISVGQSKPYFLGVFFGTRSEYSPIEETAMETTDSRARSTAAR